MNRPIITVLLLTSAAASSAPASITGVSGTTTWLGVNPPSAQAFNLTGPSVYAWDEQAAAVSSIGINLFGNGVYTGFSPYFAGFLTSPGVQSHILHYDPVNNPIAAAGSVSFSGSILGVIFDESLLTATDGILGSLGTVYDTGNPARSFGGDILGNSSLTIAGNTLNYQISASPGQINRMFEIRVLTLIPSPGTATLAAGAGLVGLRRRRR